MTTIIDEFVEKALSDEPQFTINKNNMNMFFTQISIGNAKCIWGDYEYHYEKFITELNRKLIPYAIVSNGNVYIIEKNKFGLYESKNTVYPKNAYNLDQKREELNHKIYGELFPSYYDSLPTRELTENELKKANENVRDVILSHNGTTEKPMIKQLINNQVAANILYGLIDFDEYVTLSFEERREEYITIKSMNSTIDSLIQEHANVENWEIQLNSTLRGIEAKTVTVEFEYNDKIIADKIDKVKLLRILNNNSTFSSYDFSTEKNGKKVLQYLGAGRWKNEDNEELTCKHIKKITYGKNIIYKKIYY